MLFSSTNPYDYQTHFFLVALPAGKREKVDDRRITFLEIESSSNIETQETRNLDSVETEMETGDAHYANRIYKHA